MNEETLDSYSPLWWLARLLAVPITLFAYVVKKIRIRTYNPEKDVCPGCGFKGDSGTGGKSCVIFFHMPGNRESAVIRHNCLRCWAPFDTPLFREAGKWLR